MLTELRNAGLINNSTRVNLGDWNFKRGDLGVWNYELEHRVEFARFLKEIPDGFHQLANKGNKRDLVRDHLKKFYMGMPKESEVDAVLERIINLVAFLRDGRAFEDKVGQSNFKRDNWAIIKRCELCGHKFTDQNDVSLDHIIPLSLGGADKEKNWQLTCWLCNQQKEGYWGVADLSRIESIRSVQGKFLGLNASQIIPQLSVGSNPTRYWVFERDKRRCSSPDCEASAKSEKLCIACREICFLPTTDNLASYCIGCAKRTKRTYCE